MISNFHSRSTLSYPVWFVPVSLLAFLKTTSCYRVLKLQRWGVLSWVQHQMARTQNFTVILSVKNTSFSKMVISSVIFLLQLWYVWIVLAQLENRLSKTCSWKKLIGKRCFVEGLCKVGISKLFWGMFDCCRKRSVSEPGQDAGHPEEPAAADVPDRDRGHRLREF